MRSGLIPAGLLPVTLIGFATSGVVGLRDLATHLLAPVVLVVVFVMGRFRPAPRLVLRALLAVRGTTPDLPPSVSELSRSLYLKVHSTMGLIARAERAGLVHTWTDDRDARRQLVAITAKGARLIALLYESHKRELLGARGELLDALRHLDDR